VVAVGIVVTVGVDDAMVAVGMEVTVLTEVVGCVKLLRSDKDDAFRPQMSTMTLKYSHCCRYLPVLFLLSRIFFYLIIAHKTQPFTNQCCDDTSASDLRCEKHLTSL